LPVWKAKVEKSGTGNKAPAETRDGGFSLLELILVLVVMSLAMVIAYPSMSRGKTAFHLRAVARDVVSSLRLARETAVSEQKTMKVVVDSQAQTVTVSDDVGENPRIYRLPGDVKIEGLTADGQEGLQGPLVIRFLTNGSSDQAQIMVKAETGAHLKVLLDPFIGAARVQLSDEVKTP
jgi:general secretion pathway protein H